MRDASDTGRTRAKHPTPLPNMGHPARPGRFVAAIAD